MNVPARRRRRATLRRRRQGCQPFGSHGVFDREWEVDRKGESKDRGGRGSGESLRQLDYRVNRTASALARGVPDTVAMVCPDPTNPFFTLVLDGVMSGLGEDLMLNLATPNGGEDYGQLTVERALAGDIAGLIPRAREAAIRQSPADVSRDHCARR